MPSSEFSNAMEGLIRTFSDLQLSPEAPSYVAPILHEACRAPFSNPQNIEGATPQNLIYQKGHTDKIK